MAIKNQKAYIYQIKNLVNGKIYIGSSKNYELRWMQHVSLLNKGKHHNQYLQNAWNKYGESNFEFSIIKTVALSRQYKAEQKTIDELKPFGKNGYNIASDVSNPFTYERTKNCEFCNKEYTTYYQNQKYCNECREFNNIPEEINKRKERSNLRAVGLYGSYEFKRIEDWDVDDHLAAWYDDMMEK